MTDKQQTSAPAIERVFSRVELRAADDANGGAPVIEGYALRFNSDSEDLGRMIETLAPECLDGADMSDVVALLNHDASLVLGRSTVTEGAGALALSVDAEGLKFTLTPTDTGYARDLITNMKAGVLNKCSFAFTLPEDDAGAAEWTYDDDHDVWRRHIKKIGRLYDVSIVTRPAYSDTSAAARSRDLVAAQDAKAKAERDREERARALALRHRAVKLHV